MKLFLFGGILQVLNLEFLKFRIFEIFNFHPWIYTVEHPNFIVCSFIEYSIDLKRVKFYNCIILFLTFQTTVICFLICRFTLEANIANNMYPDQTALLGAVWSGFMLFAAMIKVTWSSYKPGDIYKQTIVSGQKFSIRVTSFSVVVPTNFIIWCRVWVCNNVMHLNWYYNSVINIYSFQSLFLQFVE